MRDLVVTPRPAMTSHELDRRMAVAKEARSEGLRQIGRWLRSWVVTHMIRHVPHPGTQFTA